MSPRVRYLFSIEIVILTVENMGDTNKINKENGKHRPFKILVVVTLKFWLISKVFFYAFTCVCAFVCILVYDWNGCWCLNANSSTCSFGSFLL